MENNIEVPDMKNPIEWHGFKVTGKLTAYFTYNIKKITLDNMPPKYMDCSIHCNGKDYTKEGVVEINYYNNSILVYKRDKKGKFIETVNGNLKKVRIYGKIKVFFKGHLYEEKNIEQEDKAK